jgi:four helix bundle protein
VSSNIAEGQARYSRLELHHCLNNARGSLAESKRRSCSPTIWDIWGKGKPLLDKASELGKIPNGLIA